MKILKLRPFVADNMWGGTRLRDEFDIQSDKEKLAEAWILSCHPDGEDMIEGGEFDGRTLSDVLQNEGRSYLGSKCEGLDYFPILIKLIDAHDDLSVQVHPGDEYALKNENQLGKTECWYILDAEEGAEIIYGLKDRMTRDELRAVIEEDRILECVNHVKVKPGDLYFIPSGTLHAICSGILLAEVQQNSNVTYRVFDYNRKVNGEFRKLHKAQAGDVISLEPVNTDGKPQGETVDHGTWAETLLVSCSLFSTSLLDVKESTTVFADQSSFVSLVALDGNGVIEHDDTVITFYKGESVFVPAGLGEVRILGAVKVLETHC